MQNESPNPFARAMDQAKVATDELSRFFGRVPQGANAEALLAAHQRNIEALSEANRIALEGAQAVAKRHMEIMQQAMVELTDTLQALATPGVPQEKVSQQADLMKRTYEHAVANARELSDLIQRSNGEALEALNKRVATAMDEVKELLDQAKG